MFTSKNIEQIEKRGIAIQDIEKQLAFFAQGFPYTKLMRSASKNDGIEVFDVKKIDELLTDYKAKTASRNIIKFVPASGAASRMFKQLSEFREVYKIDGNNSVLFEKKDPQSMFYFFENIRNFAFFN
ncbi:MAG: DUF4301 family protein, partial [Bacteroidales bacterium]|nr:DUF4301 family protein [Bacteroidales bacterium]